MECWKVCNIILNNHAGISITISLTFNFDYVAYNCQKIWREIYIANIIKMLQYCISKKYLSSFIRFTAITNYHAELENIFCIEKVVKLLINNSPIIDLVSGSAYMT